MLIGHIGLIESTWIILTIIARLSSRMFWNKGMSSPLYRFLNEIEVPCYN